MYINEEKSFFHYEQDIQAQLDRRRPGQSALTTKV